MTLRISAITNRSLSFAYAPDKAQFHLPAPVAWTLMTEDGTALHGTTDRTVTAIHDLRPATCYRLKVDGHELLCETPACAGAVMPDLTAGPDSAENAARLQAAIDTLPAGGTVIIPRGLWYVAPIRLRSHMTLYLSEGATLAAPSDRSGWPLVPSHNALGRMLGSWEGLPAACHAAPVSAVGTTGLTIAGPGSLDGGGDRGDWWTWPKETRSGARRPRGLHLIDCTDTTLHGFTIRNAPSWTVHPQGCLWLTAVSLHIIAPHNSPNTDGFDPEMCRDVLIEGVHFSVGDDCIAIKAGKRADDGNADHLAPTENITIRHCLMERGHGGVVIGSEMSGNVTGVNVEACEMVGTDRGLRIKTRRGRGGRVGDISFSNVSMRGVGTAFSLNGHYFCDHDGHSDAVQNRAPAPVTELTPQIGAITASDIDLYDVRTAAGAFLGLPEAPAGPVTLRDIRIHGFAADAIAEPPVMADHIRAIRHETVIAEHCSVVTDLPLSPAGLSLPSAPKE